MYCVETVSERCFQHWALVPDRIETSPLFMRLSHKWNCGDLGNVFADFAKLFTYRF